MQNRAWGELVYLKQCNVIWLNRESSVGSFRLVTRRGGIRMQLKCRVRRRFVQESGIRERHERYIAKAVIDGTINYTPISYDVHFQNLARIQSYLTYTH